ncbi:MAG TPA: hypothetical protein VFU23_11585 [Gemmatimonadales bacterium]|nr:hypothetical protein [Gemmatimonadales bacterium]
MLNIVHAELERHATRAERAMARVRRALHRAPPIDASGLSVPLVLARKAATAAAAANAALERLSDAARGALDMEDVLDLLLAARSTVDALHESADLVVMAASLATHAGREPERWPTSLTTAADASAG